jgi:hypothetical protein
MLSQVVTPLLDDAERSTPTEGHEIDVGRLDDPDLPEACGDVAWSVGADDCAEALIGCDLGCADDRVELLL